LLVGRRAPREQSRIHVLSHLPDERKN